MFFYCCSDCIFHNTHLAHLISIHDSNFKIQISHAALEIIQIFQSYFVKFRFDFSTHTLCHTLCPFTQLKQISLFLYTHFYTLHFYTLHFYTHRLHHWTYSRALPRQNPCSTINQMNQQIHNNSKKRKFTYFLIYSP